MKAANCLSDNTDLRIWPLRERPEVASQLAEWFYNGWPYKGWKREEVEVMFSERIGADRLPTTWIASLGADLAGTISVVATFPPYDYLSPWVTSLYVPPAFRGRGIGRTLLNHALIFSRELLFNRLYLCTSGLREFYEKCGWIMLRRDEYYGSPIFLMYHECESTASLDNSRPIRGSSRRKGTSLREKKTQHSHHSLPECFSVTTMQMAQSFGV